MKQKDIDLETVNAVQKAQSPEDDTITLSTGVVLRGKQIPPLVLVKVMSAFPRPKPPQWNHPTMGRVMENPDDPDYQDSLKAWRTEVADSTLNAIILLGTELVSTPKKIPGPDSNAWLDTYKLLGVPIYPENKNWRYLAWITFIAAPVVDDLNKLKEVVGRLSGIPEDRVDAAVQFPGSK